MPPLYRTILLLTASNVFHDLCLVRPSAHDEPPQMVHCALVSWCIALFEYLLQVPANRIGAQVVSVAHTQNPAGSHRPQRLRAIRTLLPQGKMNWNFLWAGMCMLGAVYFMFRR
jgi:uncharacterized protein (DUF486 family)